MSNKPQPIVLAINATFWLHLGITLFAWVGPFLIDWWLMCSIYSLVLLQFFFLNRCVVNAGHSLEEGEGITFYAFLLERMNIYIPRIPLKKFVRGPLYFFLGVLAWAIQTFGGYIPPFSFGSSPF